MLAYSCKQCRRITVLGYENKYGEHFCSISCYEKYCKNNGYNFQKEHINKIKNILNE